MSKYIDLEDAMKADFIVSSADAITTKAVLQWLDEHPDQVPRRTITESELHSALRDYNAALYTEIDTANRLGLLVVPDPEPTNAEKLAEILRSIHDQASPEYVAESLDELGVKAPTHD